MKAPRPVFVIALLMFLALNTLVRVDPEVTRGGALVGTYIGGIGGPALLGALYVRWYRARHRG